MYVCTRTQRNSSMRASRTNSVFTKKNSQQAQGAGMTAAGVGGALGRGLSVLLLMLFRWQGVEGQGVNLVPDPSFEIMDSCIECYGGFTDEELGLTYWKNPNGLTTPDYFNVCNDSITRYIGCRGRLSTPKNFAGYQVPKSGVGYMGIFIYGANNFREYIQTKLRQPLQTGVKYYVSFYVSLGDSFSTIGSDEMGLYFSANKIIREASYNYPYVPQINNPKGNFLKDRNNWVQISGEFIGNNEEYLMIGNFKDDVHTDTSTNPGGIGRVMDEYYPRVYYYFDDVCVSTDWRVCGLASGIDKIKEKDQPINVYWNSDANFLIVKRNDVVNEPMEFVLTDMYGKNKYRQLIENPSTKIPVIDLEKGVYIAQFFTAHSVFIQKLFIY